MAGEGAYDNQEPHKRLLAWQRSIDFVVVVYELTKKLPIIVCVKLGYIHDAVYEETRPRIVEIEKLLGGLINKLGG